MKEKDDELTVEMINELQEYVASGMFEQDHRTVLPSTKKYNEEKNKTKTTQS